MGGRPVTALAIAGFPDGELDHATIGDIFKGGVDKLREAGTALLGGHTVRDKEIKFGYAVTGAVDSTRVWTNGGARPGDVLLLTKPIGTGVIGTAIKFDRVASRLADEAIAHMRTLNKNASETLVAMGGGVHACTDITGFGLIGHATEMAEASGVTIAIEAAKVPTFDGVLEIVGQNRSGGMISNRTYFAEGTSVARTVPVELQDLLYDPQTSGGLLIAVDPGRAALARQTLENARVSVWEVGSVGERTQTKVEVR
jgi:selenide,water dikinase